MDKSSSQMLALLGLLAVAGYQNRDKLGESARRTDGWWRNPSRNAGNKADRYSGRAAARRTGRDSRRPVRWRRRAEPGGCKYRIAGYRRPVQQAWPR